ncbi:efflux RND transporter periplasmic adaptor subunit [Pseudooceanicola sp. CBS1P-1]|uniref:Efflux RND transporter periplasmic adaptor subunit n=1 Tax=Pseudooceanicola albus TaxID=2692189 RepID=A0A6L7G3L2_9RHOB|nr:MULTISPECIES: efflux RND transporter periplasmic adaptor subunit [Pseudooceanicola]MBT9384970.1 efflux RND transporter periplasmic adaptor subunit [Pseudooceanicola endophyticus]MXN18036.1 efflux RND transporter periplasmic adaptor subunit [Pseudooceanicola albus]
MKAPMTLALLALLALPAQADTRAESGTDTGAAATPRPVISEIVTADPTRERAFPGEVEAAHETDLAFQTVGRIATLPVQVGDRVQKGQVLATLDRVTLQQDVDAAQAALSSAQAQADYARTSWERTQSLKARNIASQSDLESARASYDSAAASVTSAQADLDSAQDALDYATLTAPSDGIILTRPVEVGTVVASGTTVLTLADLTGREAVIDVPAEFLSVLPPDAVFTLRRQEGDAETARATLRLVEPVADDRLRGRTLRLRIAEGPGLPAFRIGSLVRATYAVTGEEVITLPKSAIAGTPDAPSVWRVTPGSRAVQAVTVTLGAPLGTRVEIRSGIAVGDEVVTRGAGSLKAGQIVGAREE